VVIRVSDLNSQGLGSKKETRPTRRKKEGGSRIFLGGVAPTMWRGECQKTGSRKLFYGEEALGKTWET